MREISLISVFSFCLTISFPSFAANDRVANLQSAIETDLRGASDAHAKIYGDKESAEKGTEPLDAKKKRLERERDSKQTTAEKEIWQDQINDVEKQISALKKQAKTFLDDAKIKQGQIKDLQDHVAKFELERLRLESDGAPQSEIDAAIKRSDTAYRTAEQMTKADFESAGRVNDMKFDPKTGEASYAFREIDPKTGELTGRTFETTDPNYFKNWEAGKTDWSKLSYVSDGKTLGTQGTQGQVWKSNPNQAGTFQSPDGKLATIYNGANQQMGYRGPSSLGKLHTDSTSAFDAARSDFGDGVIDNYYVRPVSSGNGGYQVTPRTEYRGITSNIPGTSLTVTPTHMGRGIVDFVN